MNVDASMFLFKSQRLQSVRLSTWNIVNADGKTGRETTNLGVRSSNLFGRATSAIGLFLNAFFRATGTKERTFRRLRPAVKRSYEMQSAGGAQRFYRMRALRPPRLDKRVDRGKRDVFDPNLRPLMGQPGPPVSLGAAPRQARRRHRVRLHQPRRDGARAVLSAVPASP